MLEKISKLIDVKTIVTFAIIGTLVFLAVTDRIESNKVYELAMIIIGFFFAHKAAKTTE